MGESLAQAALASEYLILRLAKIAPKDRNRYTGRSQFPAMMARPAMGKLWANKYECEFCRFWNNLLTKLSRMRNCSAQNSGQAKLDVAHMLSEIGDRWPRNTKPELKSDFLEAFRDLNDINMLNALVGLAATLKQKAISNLIAESQTMKTFVKEELVIGGGQLFNFGTKEINDFLYVSLEDLSGTSLDPNQLLNSEFDCWTKFWGCPEEHAEEATAVGVNLRQFHRYALSELPEPLNFNAQALDNAMSNYKKQ